MLINSISNINFKGYDATPIKTLHIATKWGQIKDELDSIAQKEGFEIQESKYNGSFNQDFKVILENNGSKKLILQDSAEFIGPYLNDISKTYQMPTELIERGINCPFVAGGNFFIGKLPNGEKYLLVSATEARKLKDKKALSNLYGIKEENIHFITHQDYHLDMSVRPIGYPYVLVNDPNAVIKNKEKAKINKGVKNNKPGKSPKIPSEEIDRIKMYAFKKSIEDLERAGFKPILIAGAYDIDVNFINAIVNKHPDNSISYITNSSKCDNIYTSRYQKIFEKDLKRKLAELAIIDPNAPKLKAVYFVKGQDFGS